MAFNICHLCVCNVLCRGTSSSCLGFSQKVLKNLSSFVFPFLSSPICHFLNHLAIPYFTSYLFYSIPTPLKLFASIKNSFLSVLQSQKHSHVTAWSGNGNVTILCFIPAMVRCSWRWGSLSFSTILVSFGILLYSDVF